MRSVVTSVSSSLPTHGHSFSLSPARPVRGIKQLKLEPREKSPLLPVVGAWGPYSDLLLVYGWSLDVIFNIKHKPQTSKFLTFLHLTTINFSETLKNMIYKI